MKLFDFDLDEARDRFGRDDWIHCRPGVTPEFLDHIREAADAHARRAELEGRGLAGAKQQLLYDFDSSVDLEQELFGPIARVFGLDPAGLVLSERHIKRYDDDAPPDPLPHKDRLASTISLGVTVRAPEGTRAFLHVDAAREVNQHMDTHLVASLGSADHPAVAVDAADALEISDQPGDVLAFAGSSTWHGRRSPAGAVLLYLKFNDFGADPLGEDPRHEARTQASRSRLASAADGDAVVGLGPRFVAISERSIAPDWRSATVAEVWDRGPLQLAPLEADLLRACARRRSLRELQAELGDDDAVLAAIERFVNEDVLVLSG